MTSFIETQFPVSRLSKESQKERKSNTSQTLTGLGKWWGRKPLVLCRATILGLLLPATDDAQGDRACFLALLTMDDDGLLRRFKGLETKVVRELATPEEISELDGYNDAWRGESDKDERRRLKEAWTDFRADLERRIFLRLPYDEQIAFCHRPENIDGPSPEAWEKINAHLGTTASTLPELVREVGQRRFGRVPRVGDAFCGGGSIPFEAARIGCETHASDLNPVAALLTWSSLNIIGGGSRVAEKVRDAQAEIYASVDAQVTDWGIEHKTEDLPSGEWEKLTTDLAAGTITLADIATRVWRADAYLYCVEVRCPETGWLVPLAPSWIIGQNSKTIATLVPLPEEKRYRIDIKSGASATEMKSAKLGTIRNGQIIHPVLEELGRDPASIDSVRNAGRGQNAVLYHANGLRLWENDDVVPRPDDVFQERLYCVRWVSTRIDRKSGKPRTTRNYRSVTEHDLEREQRTLDLLRERFATWQEQGFIPSMRIESGSETDRLFRERGWTHWHHLFNPRQLLVLGEFVNEGLSKNVDKRAAVLALLGVMKSADHNSKLSGWSPLAGKELVDHVFANQALNTLNNHGVRAIIHLETCFSLQPKIAPVTGDSSIITEDGRLVSSVCDFWVTDPPYADAVNYHELSDFFLGWVEGPLARLFPKWQVISRKALAVTGQEESFRRSMVDCYRNLAEHMPDDGMQVVMFTHQDAAVWADLALILWASGLRVSAAWCISTETTSALKEGNYVQGTVLLILRKQTGEDTAFLDEVYPEVEVEVQRQLDSMRELDDPHADAPDFTDTDYQLAAYAAALRVLTRYRSIEDIDVARELARPKAARGKRAEPTELEKVIAEAVRIACDHLVPPGIDRPLWRVLGPAERFYLKGLDLESRGEFRSGAYQELARGFGLRDYTQLLGNAKANEVRLMTATEFGRKLLRAGEDAFSESLLRHALFAIREVAKADQGAEPGRAWLKAEVKDYWAHRKTLIAILQYLARFENSLPTWEPDAKAAALLAGALENDH